jgi:hypothetical protein
MVRHGVMHSIAARVARRYTAPSRVTARYLSAMEHSSPEALKEYLREHPGADPKNHSVSKGKGDKGGDKPKVKPADHPSAQKGAMSWAKADMAARKLYDGEEKLLKDIRGPKGEAAIKKYTDKVDGIVKNLQNAAKHYEAALKDSDNDKAKDQLYKVQKLIKEMAESKGDKITPNTSWVIPAINKKISDASEGLGMFRAEHLTK